MRRIILMGTLLFAACGGDEVSTESCTDKMANALNRMPVDELLADADTTDARLKDEVGTDCMEHLEDANPEDVMTGLQDKLNPEVTRALERSAQQKFEEIGDSLSGG